MGKPFVKFNALLPEALGKLVDSNWEGVTLPGIGIFFKNSKKKVSTSLFKHECFHWYQGEIWGLLFYPVIFLDYAVSGYDKSLFEKRAKEYAKNPLTKVEQAWWDSL